MNAARFQLSAAWGLAVLAGTVLSAPVASPKGDDAKQTADEIIAELKSLPPTRGPKHSPLSKLLADPPEFRAKALEAFRRDAAEVPGDRPLRKAFLEAVHVLQEGQTMPLPEEYAIKDKQAFAKLQGEVAQTLFGLEQAIETMREAAEHRRDEKSKRWTAHFDLAYARLLARYVYLYEYNQMIGHIRTEHLPDFDANPRGWKLQAKKGMSPLDRKVREAARMMRETLTSIREQYPDTPWSWLAAREIDEPLGLEWKAKE